MMVTPPAPLVSHLLTRLSLAEVHDLCCHPQLPIPAEDLLTRWRQAHIKALDVAEKEAHCADEAAVLPLPQAMQAHVQRLLDRPEMERLHSQVPVAVGLVEVDALMTARRWMDTAQVQAHAQRIGKRPPDSQLVRKCLPLRPSAPAGIQVQQLAGGALVLRSAAGSLQLLRPPQLSWQPEGSPATAEMGQVMLDLGLAQVPPVMHALRFQGRLLLRRGHHRARALRAMGLAYLPCLLSVCVHLDEVRWLAPELTDADCEHFTQSSRPTLLRDFDRPSMVMDLPTPEVRQEWEVRVQVSQRHAG